MKSSVGRFQAICLALAIAPALRAEDVSVDLEPAKTQIAFILTDVLHTVRGRFGLKRGHISLDPATGVITGDLIVDAASGSSGSGARDKRMTREILEAQRFPEIRFAPAKFAGSLSLASASSIQVTGSFFIHGGTHEITVPMQIQVSEGKISATGKFIVPYVEWGMKNPSTFLIKCNDKVEIDVTAAGQINGPHSAFSPR